MRYNHNDKIYQINIPIDYVLSNLEKDINGEIRYPRDADIMIWLNAGKTIGEAILLVCQNSLLPSSTEKSLCKRYLKIIKSYIHEYNSVKQINKHNKETT